MRAFNSSIQVFPIHDHTLQGALSSVPLDDQHIGVVHCLEDTDVTFSVAGGGSITITGLPAGFDFRVPGNAGTITTTGSILLS
jgi:hypothetical protein